MEETAEGLAKAAATREAAKRKRSELEANGIVDEPVAKKVVAPPQAISHEVALPDDFVSEYDAQPDVYGTQPYTCWGLPCPDGTGNTDTNCL